MKIVIISKTLRCYLDFNTIGILYREWALASQHFGKVLLINGPSSSGKTTLLKCLEKFGFHSINLDDLWPECYCHNIVKAAYNHNDHEFITKFSLIKSFLNPLDFLKIIDSSKIAVENYNIDQIEIIEFIQRSLPNIIKVTNIPTYQEV